MLELKKPNLPANAVSIKSKTSRICNVRLRISLGTIALLIEQGNEKLWPIFDKLENELSKLEQQERRLSQYRK